MEKRIEVCKMKAGDIKTGFGNPRKISKKKLEELERSIEMYGDFGIFLIDEHDNVIAGNQRLKVILRKYGPDRELDCKRLIGYTEAELRAININDNNHAGEWDTDLLSSWTADLNGIFGMSQDDKDSPQERDIKMMELLRYEKYDYVMIVCRNEIDYLQLTRALGIDEAKVLIAQKRKIRARAIWYDDMKAQIVKKPEGGKKNYDL